MKKAIILEPCYVHHFLLDVLTRKKIILQKEKRKLPKV